jgi:hypothetical protein
MDMVLTSYPSIDEGQIMIFVKAGAVFVKSNGGIK